MDELARLNMDAALHRAAADLAAARLNIETAERIVKAAIKRLGDTNQITLDEAIETLERETSAGS